MTPPAQAVLAPASATADAEEFAAALVAGLSSRPQKSIPCKFLYDARGALFTMICRLPEYYPTRTEFAILRRYGDHIANRLPAGAVLVEFGSGTSRKVDLLLARMAEPAAYVPLDVSVSCLDAAAARLARLFPGVRMEPVVADFSQPFRLPATLPHGPRVGFFPDRPSATSIPPTPFVFSAASGGSSARAAA